MWPWKKSKRELVRKETPIGDFTRWSNEPNAEWEGSATANGIEIYILADNVEGQPDPHLVAQVPGILLELTALENMARVSIPELAERLTSKHCLAMITSCPDADFTLGFSYHDEVWEEVVYVDFKGRNIVGWCSVD